jgi:hypothetical protein
MAKHDLIPHPVFCERRTLSELAAAASMHPDFVRRVFDYGLLESVDTDEGTAWFDAVAECRLRTIGRLRDDLGINLPGIGAVLDLLERIESLQGEIRILRGRIR